MVVPEAQLMLFKAFFGIYTTLLKEENQTVEPELQFLITECALPELVMADADFVKIVNVLYAVPNGVYRMSPDIEGLVEASSNLARVMIKDGVFITQSLQRSSVESTKEDVAQAVGAGFENIGCEVSLSGDYPGWKPNPDSAILRLMASMYTDRFGKAPKVEACHAGLECGILGGHLPGMDMISFGPTIRGAHSPDERVQISSVEKFWSYLLEVLKAIPEREKAI